MTTPMTDARALDLLDLSPPISLLSSRDITLAYRRMARRTHPDTPGGGDEAKFRLVTQAFGYLNGRLSGEIPEMVQTINENPSRPAQRTGPVWTKSHAKAADAINFDDIVDGLRTIMDRPVSPLVEELPNGELLVSRVPAGGSVSFNLARGGAIAVYGPDGHEIICDREIVLADRFSGGDDVLGGFSSESSE